MAAKKTTGGSERLRSQIVTSRSTGAADGATVALPVEQAIVRLRGQRVMLDEALAELYGVPVKRLNEQVKRNIERFPEDFMFQLTEEEVEILRSQIATSRSEHGGRRYLPYAFTEQGVAMLSSVLRSERAVQVNIEIMRTFVRLRGMLAEHAELARQLERLEKKYDAQFRVVFDAIRELMTPTAKAKRPIDFRRKA
ncbi:MAG: ORF6N domain-containing protein [Polyangiaceae bacterium]|nr:ORF6N domain-containing protein [Polyangiaceae bacterium]